MADDRPAHKHPLALAIFGLALFGLLVVVQLALKASGADVVGCSGEAGAGCASVTAGAYRDFLGVSNVVWGGLFYSVVAALRLGYGATGDDRLRLASLAVVAGGLLYTLRLVYLQAAVIHQFCALCMTSAATVTLLAVLLAAEHLRLRGAARAVAPSAITSPS